MAEFKTKTGMLQFSSFHSDEVIVVWNSSRKLQRRSIHPIANKKHSYHKTHHQLLLQAFRDGF